MTYGMLKQRILALLDVNAFEMVETSFPRREMDRMLPQAINTAARKVALLLKGVYRQTQILAKKEANGVFSDLPLDCVAAKTLFRGGSGADVSFEIMGDRLFLPCGVAGQYTLGYFALPTAITEETPGDLELEYDDFTADLVAYGAASEFCHTLYPDDMKRYMRLSTEFDERIVNAMPRAGEKSVINSVFGRTRGVRT